MEEPCHTGSRRQNQFSQKSGLKSAMGHSPPQKRVFASLRQLGPGNVHWRARPASQSCGTIAKRSWQRGRDAERRRTHCPSPTIQPSRSRHSSLDKAVMVFYLVHIKSRCQLCPPFSPLWLRKDGQFHWESPRFRVSIPELATREQGTLSKSFPALRLRSYSCEKDWTGPEFPVEHSIPRRRWNLGENKFQGQISNFDCNPLFAVPMHMRMLRDLKLRYCKETNFLQSNIFKLYWPQSIPLLLCGKSIKILI